MQCRTTLALPISFLGAASAGVLEVLPLLAVFLRARCQQWRRARDTRSYVLNVRITSVTTGLHILAFSRPFAIPGATFLLLKGRALDLRAVSLVQASLCLRQIAAFLFTPQCGVQFYDFLLVGFDKRSNLQVC